VEGPNTARAQQLVAAFYQGGQADQRSPESVSDLLRRFGINSPDDTAAEIRRAVGGR
jgi:hypothetical protein